MSAKQTSAAVGVCSHLITHEVTAQSGAVLAIRCTGCTLVLGAVGTCDGCKSTTKLITVRVEKTGRRYCSKDCLAAERKEARKALDEKAKLGPGTKNPARQR